MAVIGSMGSPQIPQSGMMMPLMRSSGGGNLPIVRPDQMNNDVQSLAHAIPQSIVSMSSQPTEQYHPTPQRKPPQSGQAYDSDEDFQGMLDMIARGQRKSGGRLKRADGGVMPIGMADPSWSRQDMRSSGVHAGGLFGGNAPGRSDTLPVDVPVNSHVIPADVVAALGKGNTLSGGNILTGMFHSLPYGIQGGGKHASLNIPHSRLPMPSAAGSSIPAVSSAPEEMDSAGGRHKDHGRATVPIMASSGEFNVSPQGVYQQGLRSAKNMHKDINKMTHKEIMNLGHDVIDEFILEVRKREIKTLQRLPPPKKK